MTPRGNNLGQTGDPFASFLLGQVQWLDSDDSGLPDIQRGVHGAVGQRRIQGQRQPDADPRVAVRLPVRAHRTRRPILHVRSEHAEPGGRQHPRRADLRRRLRGMLGTPDVRRPEEGRVGSARRVRLPARRTERFRGGYGIYYAGVAFSQFTGQPTIGFAANLLAPNLSNGVCPAFYLDDGFPAANVVRPPFINPTFANGTAPLAVAPDGLTLPRFQNWSVTYQRQLTDNMMLDVSYIGNRGSRLNHHFQTMGVDANQNDPSVLALGASGAAVGHQFAGGAGGRHHAAVSRLRGQRRAGAPKVPAVPDDRVARRADRKEPVPRAGSWCSNAASHAACRRASATRTRRLKNNGAESAQGDNGSNDAVQNPGDSARVGAQRRRRAARVPGRIHLGDSRLGEVDVGLVQSGARRLEHRRHSPLRKRPAVQHRHEQRSRGLPVQRPEASKSQPGCRSRRGRRRFRSQQRLLLQPGGVERSRAAEFRERAAARRRRSAGSRLYSEDINVFKVFPLQNDMKLRFQASVGNLFNRTLFCDPGNTNWSSGSFGQVGHAVQSAAVGPVCVEVRFLSRRRLR